MKIISHPDFREVARRISRSAHRNKRNHLFPFLRGKASENNAGYRHHQSTGSFQFTDMNWRMRQQGQVTGPFYLPCQKALMPGTGTAFATRRNLSPIGNEVQQFFWILVIYNLCLVRTERTYLALGHIPWFGPLPTPSCSPCFYHSQPFQPAFI